MHQLSIYPYVDIKEIAEQDPPPKPVVRFCSDDLQHVATEQTERKTTVFFSV
jgi:hypothetical protein